MPLFTDTVHFMSPFAEALRNRMQQLGITTRQFSALTDISLGMVSRITNDRGVPPIWKLDAIMDALQLSDPDEREHFEMLAYSAHVREAPAAMAKKVQEQAARYDAAAQQIEDVSAITLQCLDLLRDLLDQPGLPDEVRERSEQQLQRFLADLAAASKRDDTAADK
jgi:transcriptional regulator with XRE-family HTH domain